MAYRCAYCGRIGENIYDHLISREYNDSPFIHYYCPNDQNMEHAVLLVTKEVIGLSRLNGENVGKFRIEQD